MAFAEAKVAEAYVGHMKGAGFDQYAINVSDGDVVSEMTKLALNAGVDAIVLGTSTKTPIDTQGVAMTGDLGPMSTDILLWAPCPVIVVPPALIPGLARG
jgi:nucleotide-binding universal stress UspA family protein